MKLSRKIAERRFSDLIRGQQWRGTHARYHFICRKHGNYLQDFSSHKYHGCNKCAIILRADSRNLGIKEANRRFPEMTRGQAWRGIKAKYSFTCRKHGKYIQQFSSHDSGHGCPACGKAKWIEAQRCLEGINISQTPEYQTVHGHCRWIQGHGKNKIHYAGMPFFDKWNPKKGGSYAEGAKWIIENLGKRPKKGSIHVVDHGKGFVPGNLEWASRSKQSNQQMFRIIAQLKHRIKQLEQQLSDSR